MTDEIVFLVEERSMEALLRVIIPKLIPDQCSFYVIPHEGKSDLEASIPRKLRGWKKPGTRFVVVCDKDSADCHAVKQRLVDLCRRGHRSDTLVRVVCHHLESWYLGDLAAVEAAFGKSSLARHQEKRTFRDPDAVPNAEQLLHRLVPEYQKISGSRAIAAHMSLADSDNKSKSFRVFVSAVRALFHA